jgi:hypothetical protein
MVSCSSPCGFCQEPFIGLSSGVRFGQLLATGDDVSGDQWDPRQAPEHATFPEMLFWLSVEASLNL